MATPIYPLFPAKKKVDEIIAQAKANLPIKTENALTAVLATFANAFNERIVVLEEELVISKETQRNAEADAEKATQQPYWNPKSHWDDHTDYPTEDWKSEVMEGDTRQSYVEWVNARIDADLEDPNAH